MTLVVPTYQQGIDAGGGASTNSNGDVFAADRAYGPGPFGYLGSSSTRSTSAAIAGTDKSAAWGDVALNAYIAHKFAGQELEPGLRPRVVELVDAQGRGRLHDPLTLQADRFGRVAGAAGDGRSRAGVGAAGFGRADRPRHPVGSGR